MIPPARMANTPGLPFHRLDMPFQRPARGSQHSRRIRHNAFFIVISCFLALQSTATVASELNVDSISISTISGIADSNGITFSSSIYFSPGSSITLQSASGYINTSSSVTGSAFFGNANALTGVIRQEADNIFDGGITFTSSVTIQSGGRTISLSTGASAVNVHISSFGSIAFYPELHNSSHTTMPQFTTTSSTFGPCITGSTLTITTAGGRVEITFTGITSAGTGVPRVSFLQDGQLIPSFTTSTAVGGNITHWGMTTPYNYIVSPSAGQHSYCATLITASGVGTAALNADDDCCRNLFFVKEIR